VTHRGIVETAVGTSDLASSLAEGRANGVQSTRKAANSISVRVRLIHQVFHLDLFPAGLITAMTHASCVLLPKSSRHVSFTATPGGADLVSKAGRERECGQYQNDKSGQPNHGKQKDVHDVGGKVCSMSGLSLSSNDSRC
jgi:hypothetical protein